MDDDLLVPLTGGQGHTWRATDVVLRPVDDKAEAEWVASVFETLDDVGFRVGRPVAGAAGSFVENGWTAWTFVEGRHDFAPHRWDDVLRVGRDFHAAMAHVAFPPFLDRRESPWAEGDRAAWGEVDLRVDHVDLAPLVERLVDGLRPVNLPRQVIHGDLGGNVLFADGLPPAVIDFSPYHRPVEFALAVVVNDALAWYEAPASIVDALDDVADLDQLLRRAAIYRLVTADRLAADRPAVAASHARQHRRVAELVNALAG